ncbi:MAG: ABC transporter substrate-binding protein [Candidatus Riflebacteria bacterium]|nr:ABC transporter substrate-binding protein [Candidatus Riflebacteria bacterium]
MKTAPWLALVLFATVLVGPAAAQDNVLRVAVLADVKGLDPVVSDDFYANTAAIQVFEGLMQYSYLARPYSVEPCLAESMPTVSPDGLTYTFRLRKGVRFADDPCFAATGGKGREMTAADFVYSWKRLADQKNHSAGWWVFDGKVRGLDAFREASSKAKGATDYSLAVEGLTTPDPHTLVVKLTRPYPQLLYVLAMTFTAVVPREAVDTYAKEIINHPVGTGPFKIEQWVRNNQIVFVRNLNFRGQPYPSVGAPGDKDAGLLEDAGKPMSFVDRVEFSIIVEDQPRWLRLLSGDLDFGGIPKDNFDAAIDRKTRLLKPELAANGLRLTTALELDTTMTVFNMEDPILGKNKLLRRAMSLAYDNARRIELFYNGRAIAAQSPIPPEVFGYDPARRNPWAGVDLEKAKALLAEAGYPGGAGLPEFTFEAMADTTSRQFGELFCREMAKLGVKVKPNANTWPEFSAKMLSRRGQIFGYAWRADYPDPENFLQLLYGPNGAPGPNSSNFKNSRYDELYEKMKAMPDTPERKKLIDEMIAILHDEVPWIYGVHRTGYTLVHRWVKNYKFHAVGHEMYKYLRVDPALREQARKGM